MVFRFALLVRVTRLMDVLEIVLHENLRWLYQTFWSFIYDKQCRETQMFCARASVALPLPASLGAPPPVALATGGNPPSRHAPRAALPSILRAPKRLRRRPTIAGSGKSRLPLTLLLPVNLNFVHQLHPEFRYL